MWGTKANQEPRFSPQSQLRTAQGYSTAKYHITLSQRSGSPFISCLCYWEIASENAAVALNRISTHWLALLQSKYWCNLNKTAFIRNNRDRNTLFSPVFKASSESLAVIACSVQGPNFTHPQEPLNFRLWPPWGSTCPLLGSGSVPGKPAAPCTFISEGSAPIHQHTANTTPPLFWLVTKKKPFFTAWHSQCWGYEALLENSGNEAVSSNSV